MPSETGSPVNGDEVQYANGRRDTIKTVMKYTTPYWVVELVRPARYEYARLQYWDDERKVWHVMELGVPVDEPTRLFTPTFRDRLRAWWETKWRKDK